MATGEASRERKYLVIFNMLKHLEAEVGAFENFNDRLSNKKSPSVVKMDTSAKEPIPSFREVYESVSSDINGLTERLQTVRKQLDELIL